jgi:hypothetical protein
MPLQLKNFRYQMDIVHLVGIACLLLLTLSGPNGYPLHMSA